MTDVPSAADVAYRHIRDAILSGAYEPGTMLGEIPLAREIGVSRTPVRAALALLQDEGWIIRYPKRGALVRGLTDEVTKDLIDARFILEATGVLRSSHSRRLQLRECLEAHIQAQREALAQADLPAFIESTIAYHRAFVEVGENQVLLELYGRLADRQRYLLFKLGPRLLERAEAIIAEHQDLLTGLIQDDPTSFSETLRKHLGDTSGQPVRPLCPPPS